MHDYLVKLLLVGESGVGKSCILNRYIDDFFEQSFIATIGIDFKIKTIKIGSKYIKLQIWDTAGQERFRTITSAYYRGAMGALLVYDVTNQQSFDQINNWIKEIDQHAQYANYVLIGNKTDKNNRVITSDQGLELANRHNISFYETSAKNNTNIEDVFNDLTSQILDRLSISTNPDVSPNVNVDTAPRKNKRCCNLI